MTTLKSRLNARPYTKGATREGIDLWLDSNEGAMLLTDDEIARAAARACVRRYPDASGLEREIAARLGVPAPCVVVTAGGDEAIDRVCRAFIEPGNEVVLPTPTFEMIGRYARGAGAEPREVRWEDSEFPVGDVVRAVSPRTAMIAAVSPNNPTGAVARAADLLALSAAAPDAVLLVDLAYTEFAEVDLTPVAIALPNAVLVRTFSKAFGLAGIRVGYAVAREEIATALRAAAGPYPVSAPSLEIARAALDADGARLSANVARVRQERETLVALLRSLGARASDSQGNFVLAAFHDADAVWNALGANGIAVRRFATPGLRGSLRIGCPGNEPDFARLRGALERAMRSQS